MSEWVKLWVAFIRTHTYINREARICIYIYIDLRGPAILIDRFGRVKVVFGDTHFSVSHRTVWHETYLFWCAPICWSSDSSMVMMMNISWSNKLLLRWHLLFDLFCELNEKWKYILLRLNAGGRASNDRETKNKGILKRAKKTTSRPNVDQSNKWILYVTLFWYSPKKTSRSHC